MVGKLNIVCVQRHNYLGRGIEYVNILFDMVHRNISDKIPYTFICFTDLTEGLNPAIETRSLPENLIGWFNKLYLFKEGLFPDGDRIIYFDLDTVITGGLDDIIKYEGDFAILKDFYHPRYAPGMMLWRAGKMAEIWESYEKGNFPTNLPLGDLTWINMVLADKPDVIQELFPWQVGSYKVHAQMAIPKGMRVVCFHGQPRPHECIGWVPHVWKIGGGTTAELELVGNTGSGELVRNIRHSINLGLESLQSMEKHDGHACIVGGAPSLKTELESLRARKDHGQIIFATNNTYNYLLENGILPDFHVMLDAREGMVGFIPILAQCLYSSQCHPEVFRKAKERGNDVYLWHHNALDIFEVLNGYGRNSEDAIIAGGQSVGLKAIAIAHFLGFREFHIYGMDSSYQDEEHHSYAQSLNDNETVMEVICDNVRFRAAPWMITQAEQFKDIVGKLTRDNCTLTIHGYGLIPFIARRL